MRNFIYIIFFLFCNNNIVYAESSAYRFGEAAGYYLGMVDVLEKLSNSDCNVHVQGGYSLARVKSEILYEMPIKYHEEYGSLLNSSKFKSMLDSNKSMLLSQLEVLRNSGMSKAESCTTAFAYF